MLNNIYIIHLRCNFCSSKVKRVSFNFGVQQTCTIGKCRPSSGCRNEERNTPSLVNQPVVIGKNDGISWIANYVIRSHEHA